MGWSMDGAQLSRSKISYFAQMKVLLYSMPTNVPSTKRVLKRFVLVDAFCWMVTYAPAHYSIQAANAENTKMEAYWPSDCGKPLANRLFH